MQKLILSFVITIVVFGRSSAQNAKVSAFNDTQGFIENKGQILDQRGRLNNKVKYLYKSPGLNVQLKQNSFSYDTYEVFSKPYTRYHDVSAGKKIKPYQSTYRIHRIDIELQGANPLPQIIAEERSENYSIYYATSKAIRAYQFERVTYRNIYPGIDLVFDTKNIDGENKFEYYFIVKPGADPSLIKLKYKGARTYLKGNKIVIRLNNGQLEENIPASFVSPTSPGKLSQLLHEARHPVSYKKEDEGLYGFSISAYDHTKTLVIDPTPDIVWGTYWGGNNNDWGYCIARDANGDILVGGASDNPGFATAGAFQTTMIGFSDAMFGKFSSAGKLIWMTYFGGPGWESVFGICSDNNNNIYITGTTSSKSGITTPGSYQPVHGEASTPYDGNDGFIAKFTSTGSRVWSTYYGGNEVDYLHAIKADGNGNLFVAGWTHSTTGIASLGAFQTANGSTSNPQDWGDAVLACFSTNGMRVWGTYYGGSNFDRFYDMALDNNGNICASGIAYSQGLSTSGSYKANVGGLYDALLVKFDNAGNRIWATYYGGDKEDYSEAIACDNQSNIIIGGTTNSLNGIATAGTYLSSYSGNLRDGFIAKFDPGGNRQWGTYYGGTGEDWVYGVTSDLTSNIIATGTTSSGNNIATANSYQSTTMGSGGGLPYITKLTANGTRLWGTYYGYGNMYGNGDGENVITDNAGNVFACGRTMAPNNIATCNAPQKTWGKNQDIFVAMFSETLISSVVSVSINSNPSAVCAGSSITFTAVAINGGTSPFYQWKINGINTGSNNVAFTTAGLNNGDQVSCTVTSNSPCISNPIATSNIITVSIAPTIVPSVNISSTGSGGVCAGVSITFNATPTNGGTTPSYQWKLNGSNVGTNSSTYTTSGLVTGDAITCTMTSSAPCANPISVTSNVITSTVIAAGAASVNINASASPTCAGSAVTFTATAINGGPTPAYQWKLNGVDVGNLSTFTTTTLVGGDVVTCIMISSLACANPSSATSNIITVTPSVTPSVSISTPNPTICQGTTVTFTATPVNGGATPYYQWKVNGLNVGTNSAIYTTSSLVNGDLVSCGITSSVTCTSTSYATSNVITINITPPVTPSVNINTSSSTTCPGVLVVFNATPVNGGAAPSYQWKLNGANVGTNAATYSTSSIANNDVISCTMTSSFVCLTTASVASNTITMTVAQSVNPSISISTQATVICAGTSAMFTAVPVNGGSAPVYQWKVNGINVGTNSATYTTNSLANNDIVSCMITSSLACATTPSATSNAITVKITPSVTPSVTINGPASTICAGSSVNFTATALNGGVSPSYQWKLNGQNVGVNAATYTTSSLVTGDIVGCTMTSSAACAGSPSATSNAITITVVSTAAPSVTINASSSTICAGSSVTFTATSMNGGVTSSYQWKVNGVSVGTNAATFTSSSLINGDAVTVTLTSANPCTANNTAVSNVITISIDPLVCSDEFYIPTAFTPNRDGKNDIFKPIFFGNVVSYKFSVYNRWGQKIFETTDLQKGWDGKAGGIDVDSNIFIWFCSFKFHNKKLDNRKGTVMLIR